MGLIKCNFFFRQGEDGWSETIYNNRDTLGAAMEDCLVLNGLRQQLLTGSTDMLQIRVSDENVLRDSRFSQTPGYPFHGSITAVQSGPASTCIRMRCEAGDLHRRMYFLHAPPKNCYTGAGLADPLPIQTALNAWKTELKTGHWGIKTRTLVGAAQRPFTSVTDTGLIETTSVPPVFAAGQYVQFLGVNGIMPRANRPFQVNAISPIGPTYLIGIRRWKPRPSILTGGFFYIFTYGFSAIDGVEIDGIGTRKIGRPFGQPVGRRSRER